MWEIYRGLLLLALYQSVCSIPIPQQRDITSAPTRPSARPTPRPSALPTRHPSTFPTPKPHTPKPTHTDDIPAYPPGFVFPTYDPTASPNWPTHPPTPEPTSRPTLYPTPSPSANPSRHPSPEPSARPSMLPTLPGTKLIQIIFYAQQLLLKCVPPTPATEPRYVKALAAAIAASTDPSSLYNITSANVLSMVLTKSDAAVELSYEMRITGWGPYDYSFFSNLLVESVHYGLFTEKLQRFGAAFNASGLLQASSNDVDISLIAFTQSAASAGGGFPQALVFGLTFGLGGGLCVLCTVCYLSSKGPRPWEEGYEDWFYKNEAKLRKSGIGVDSPGFRIDGGRAGSRRPTAPPLVDDIPDEDEGETRGYTVSPLASAGETATTTDRRGTQLHPPPPPLRLENDAGRAPWAVDANDRDSDILGGGLHRL